MAQSFSQTFTVTSATNSNQAQLNSTLLKQNADSLQNDTTQESQEATVEQNQLTAPAFAQLLLQDVQTTIAATTGSSADIAAAVNQQIITDFQARANQLAFNPQEYIVVWGNSSRFLLDAPSDNPALLDAQRTWIGYQVDGTAETGSIQGGVLVATPTTSGVPSLSLAIVPINASNAVTSTSNLISVVTPGLSTQPDLLYHLELQGLAATNQTGVVTFGQSGPPQTVTFTDVGTTTVVHPLDESSAATGVTGLATLLNTQVQTDSSNVFGNLDTVNSNVLTFWVDPVDFTLTDPAGQSITVTSGTTASSIPNAFVSYNSTADLVVIPDATVGQYNLQLLGTGGGFLGGANFSGNVPTSSVTFQGNLGSGSNVLTVLDFRQGGDTSSSSSAIAAPSLASSAVLGLGQVLSASLGSSLSLVRSSVETLGLGPLQFLAAIVSTAGSGNAAAADGANSLATVLDAAIQLAPDGGCFGQFRLARGVGHFFNSDQCRQAWRARGSCHRRDVGADCDHGSRRDARVELAEQRHRPTGWRRRYAHALVHRAGWPTARCRVDSRRIVGQRRAAQIQPAQAPQRQLSVTVAGNWPSSEQTGFARADPTGAGHRCHRSAVGGRGICAAADRSDRPLVGSLAS